MKKLITIVNVLIFSFGISDVFAQNNQALRDSLRIGTIENQFEYLMIVSDNYNQFEVVDIKNLDRLKLNVLDSLKILRSQYEIMRSDVGEKDSLLVQLKTDLAKANQEKEEAINNRDSLYFLGFSIYKSVFGTVMGLLVIGLILFLVVFFSRFKSSFGRVQEAEQTLLDVQEEFERHRRNALERERKMKRELIDLQMKKSKPS